MTRTAEPTFTDTHRRALAAFADTIVAAVPVPPGQTDPDGFYARTASELAIPAAAEQVLLATVAPDELTGLLALLAALAGLGLDAQPLVVREEIIAGVAASGPAAAAGLDALTKLTLMLSYALPDVTGVNPFWRTWGYPGPVAAPPQTPKTITALTPAGDTELHADVVVVGSGAGGGVIAARLAEAGHDVVVLEAGGYFNEADFVQYELVAYQNLYLRGGYFATADGMVTLVAGSNLGGGTTVNWSNSVRPRADVLAGWAREQGMAGVDTGEFSAHVDAVLARLAVNTECSDFNDPHQRLAEGAGKLGWHVRTAALNLDAARYDPELAGYTGYGDQTGAKQSTLRTWLQDAHDAGARILVRTWAEKILVVDGRAAGVQARYADPATGATAQVTVRARYVVSACGSLETPALLLRSGIGGPAVGTNLRLHPATVVGGVYPDPQRTWWGPSQAAILDEFAGKDDGIGHIIEGVQHGYGLLTASIPWRNAAEHKARARQLGHASWFVGIVQDRGSGRVTIDDAGQAVHTYPLADELDRQHVRDTVEAMVRLHEAAGADQIVVPAPGVEYWRRGADLDAFLAAVADQPLGPGGIPLFSAHQMGSAAIGLAPATSVAGPTGEMHDTPGVWIGDTSAFPTSSGVNPMVTTEALAHRTAGFISAALVQD